MQNNSLTPEVSQPVLTDQLNVLHIRELLQKSGYEEITSKVIAKARWLSAEKGLLMNLS